MDASSTATVDATIVAATLAAAGGGTAGVGASIGVSIAQNKIGTSADPSEVLAYIDHATVNAKNGALTIDATGDQVINAVVVAASAAVAGASTVGVGVSGAGSSADNLIAQHVKAYIDGDDNNANATVRNRVRTQVRPYPTDEVIEDNLQKHVDWMSYKKNLIQAFANARSARHHRNNRVGVWH
jgi:hypothetical protein